MIEYGDHRAHVVQGGLVGAGVGGQLDVDVLSVAHGLAVDFILEHAVLEQCDVRMLLQVFDILFQGEVHIVHDRGVALADKAVEVQVHGNAGLEALVCRSFQRPAVLWEAEYEAVLPGKLFEYLASRRPILGIGQTEGAMAKVVRETGSGVVYNWDEEKKIKAWIDLCWDEFKNDELKDNMSDISKYSRRKLTKRLASLLNELTHE